MPELPEVETVRFGLAAAMTGARIERVALARADLRTPFSERFVERLVGRKIEKLSRRAKYILVHLDSGEALIMHLGMSGSFRVEQNGAKKAPGGFHFARSKDEAHDHVTIMLSNGARIVYNDPRRFGSMQLAALDASGNAAPLNGLGLEPLGDDFDGAALAKLMAGRKTPLKAALLDQTLVAGLGNIYVCEALHRARLSPLRVAGTLALKRGAPSAKAHALAKAIHIVLNDAVAAGGSTLRDHRQTDGALGYFQHSFSVYEKEGAACPRPRCGGRIIRITQSGRSTFYCPTCQR
ncbi:MAG TPA: bifunctional DNA-formamidopyrimidine glycosylase/DNA-(apurinic or apyrimidinic site) lyase [Roseiarcus sp.]|nr:bifunctional DNA-formamidopyrimidine glycosylase/DNA-(apurinic or apyrimidinic site) lyase [Roseiarcus sp.]